MDTISHGIWTYFLFKKNAFKWDIVLGGMIPDLGLFFTALILSPTKLFSPMHSWLDQLYRIPFAYNVDTLFHSLPIWLGLFIISLFFTFPRRGIFLGAMIHIIIDMLTHRNYIALYLFPLSNVQIIGPVDYHSVILTIINWILIWFLFIYFAIKRWYLPLRRKNWQ